MNELNDIVYNNIGFYIDDIFCVNFFDQTLSQYDIDRYNNVIGGHFDDSGVKIKGINEYINLFNQQVVKKDKSKRLPLLTPLYKQILSDKEAISFIPEKFSDANSLLASVNAYCTDNLFGYLDKIKSLFADIDTYNLDGIFVESHKAAYEISNAVFGRWDAISNGWHLEYSENTPIKKNADTEKYETKMEKAYEKKKSFSLNELQNYGQLFKTDDCMGNVVQYFSNTVSEQIDTIKANYSEARSLLTTEYDENTKKKLYKDKDATDLLKRLLDSIKDLEHTLKYIKESEKEGNKDFTFYSNFYKYYDELTNIDTIYDKVRNYMTQKPYSKDKIKLNFNSSSFLSGWAQNYDTKGAMFFRDSDYYYIGIINKKYSLEDINKLTENAEGSDFERIIYDYQKVDNKNVPRLFIRSKGDNFAPSVEKLNLPINDVLDIYDNGYFKTEHKDKNTEKYKESLVKMIDYFKLGLSNHDSYKHYTFKWKNSEDYENISEFYKDTSESCYTLHFEKINYSHIENLINRGELYLFKIYNKDFSKYSHGKPNLHTMYFKMLFDERNLENVVYQLNGNAEMFYREASIQKEDQVVHYKNQPIKNKNTNNPQKHSTFEYDLIKDKRFTKRQFSLHIPITLNFKASGKNNINSDMRLVLKNSEKNYVIGIDRGERNLLYICVIDEKGNIVEQKSLNEIVSDNNYKVDYHKLLDDKETKRGRARKNWELIENIKELKDGYLSQVIHQIYEYVIKYDAIIAMEDLNRGFKKGRFKVEKQVYQKFEDSLSSKLNYLVKKDADPRSPGGLLKAYQLTNEPKNRNKNEKQNGIIFYVPAWLTSKIDPVTGFVDLLKPKYTSVNASLDFIKNIDDIRFNQPENMFEFDVDYSKFPKTTASYKKQWTICTNGERIIKVKNNKTNKFEDATVMLTDEFKKLFNSFGIEIAENIKDSILSIADSSFHKQFMKLLAYTLQMRNSKTNAVNVDYLLSPVKGPDGKFFDSRNANSTLPENADANGAYNIARKALWAISVLKDTNAEDLKIANLYMKNSVWLEYVQK